MQAYSAPIYGYLARCGVAPPERDDVLQEIYTRVHGAAARYDASRPLRPWLFTIAANTVRNHLRDRAHGVVGSVSLDAAGAAEPAAAAPNAEELAEARATAAWVDGAIAGLPLEQREVLVLCAVEQLPQAEVAEALGLPVNTVKTLLHRARLALAKQLARRRLEQAREGAR